MSETSENDTTYPTSEAGSKGFFNIIKAFFAKLFESFEKIFSISAEKTQNHSINEAERKNIDTALIKNAYNLVQASQKANKEYNRIKNDSTAKYRAIDTALKKYGKAYIKAISALEVIAKRDIKNLKDLIDEAERAKGDVRNAPTDFMKAKIATEKEEEAKIRLVNITNGLYKDFSDNSFEAALDGFAKNKNTNNAVEASKIDKPSITRNSQTQAGTNLGVN